MAQSREPAEESEVTMKTSGEIITGLDIGTTKICAVVGEARPDGVEIIGMGSYPSEGLRKGEVVNIEHTVNSIKEAIEEAETMAGCDISSVYAGIAGGHIKGLNSDGAIPLRGKEVTKKDIDRVIETARAVAIPMDREIIHTLVREFVVDNHGGILDPLGIAGVRLEAKIHMVTSAVTSAQNIIKCANVAGLDVCEIILQPLASSEAVLSDEERNLGIVLIDFGGGTTDLAVFSKGAVKHTWVLPLGGENLTYDIAIGLRTPMLEAEKIKIKYGCGTSALIKNDERIEVHSIGGGNPRVLSRQVLGEIIEPRVEEILSLIFNELVRSGNGDPISSGVVVTGGSAELSGIPEITEQIFNVPVRVGYPQGVNGLAEVVNRPMYATAVGLVLHGANSSKRGNNVRKRDRDAFSLFIEKIKGWFRDVA